MSKPAGSMIRSCLGKARRLTFPGPKPWAGQYSVNGILPIFRVPEYSEYLLRTGFALGFHWARTRNIKARRGMSTAHRRPCSAPVRICCLNSRERPFVDCNCDRGQGARLRATSNWRKTDTLLQRRPSWTAGISDNRVR